MSTQAAVARSTRTSLVIEPTSGWRALKLGELWLYRDLFWLLSWRDVRVRYRQTVLGVGWAVLQPLVTILVFSLVFGRLAKVPSDGAPYPAFTYSALLPWTLFSTALTRQAISLVSNSALLSKVYFPRLLLPLGSVLTALVDFAISLVILLALLAWYHIVPSPAVLFLPIFAAYALVASWAIGIWMAALNVRYRDVNFAQPFLVQIGLFISPVVYGVSLVPSQFRVLYDLNPMTLVIQGFRWGLIGDAPPTPLMLISIPVVLLLLVSGVFYFRRTERFFADII
ncbi:MAG: ABC transporter permease [Chloroflexi bacterium]|nr:MAG: ABC transporter permease [Chloroflexota bacterium]